MLDFRRLLIILILFTGTFSTIFSKSFSIEDLETVADLEEKLDIYLQEQLQKSNIPGFAVGVVNQDKILFMKGYGKTSDSQNVDSDTPFAIASLSKSFTALAVMQLVEAGKINLDEPVKTYYPDFPISQPVITIRQLLNQTSGLSDKIFPEMKFSQQPKNLTESINRLQGVFIPEENTGDFHYHNPNYQILARVVEIVSGESFSDYLQKEILSPLGMINTHNLAFTNDFYSEKGGLVPQGFRLLFGIPIKGEEIDWFVEGSAGITSTVHDMARWLMLFLNNGVDNPKILLSEKSISQMLEAENNPYGMGWFVNNDTTAHHSGILWTYQAEQKLLLKEGYGIVILFNSGLNAFQDYNSLSRGVEEIIKGHSPEPVSAMAFWLEMGMILLVILTFYFGFRSLRNSHKWAGKKRPIIVLKILLKILPILILLSLPWLLFLLSGRVLNWNRVFWMMPSIIIWLGIQSIFNLFIILLRLKMITFFIKKSNLLAN